ncbi:WD repeat-containing protein [Nitzschia inconspicua]|uniref:WD repeat-containing protein n=1 Tax=Nitzschia inconspicua TaxID=303405 RepID=A0A9K3KK78_9STRA|nr:WD repeat-containing protein [Nitzschia inconspicua]
MGNKRGQRGISDNVVSQRPSKQMSLLSFWSVKSTPTDTDTLRTDDDTEGCLNTTTSSPSSNVIHKGDKENTGFVLEETHQNDDQKSNTCLENTAVVINSTVVSTKQQLCNLVTPAKTSNNVASILSSCQFSETSKTSKTHSVDTQFRNELNNCVCVEKKKKKKKKGGTIEENINDERINAHMINNNNNSNNNNNNNVENDDTGPVLQRGDVESVNDNTHHQDHGDDGNDPPLSEYEKLRLRNIERNNARLAALGLLNCTTTTTTMKRSTDFTKRKRPIKRPASTTNVPRPPTRRSTRSRRTVLLSENDNQAANGDELGDILSRENSPEELPVVNVEYSHSPLYHYDARNTIIEKHDTAAVVEFSKMTSLCITGKRLCPPKGLSAIYSLNFWGDQCEDVPWLVGAGKAGLISIWNIGQKGTVCMENEMVDTALESIIDPIMAWKAHKGRWIADAKFLPAATKNTPQQLLTAGNDGTVCLWDLYRIGSDGVPKLTTRSTNELHASGIFCMDVSSKDSNNNTNNAVIATGSKDKTIAVFNIQAFANGTSAPLWRSHFHTAKVGAVQFQGSDSTVLASASDDGIVAIHDYRMNGRNACAVVAELDNAHRRPHSVVWDPSNTHVLATAGMDPYIKLWDWRNLSAHLATLEGHVPVGRSCKQIHRPTFVPWRKRIRGTNETYLFSGGEGSGCLSTFQIDYGTMEITNNNVSPSSSALRTTLLSRGELVDGGDAGCIAVQGNNVAVSVNQGEVVLLKPTDYHGRHASK